MDDKFLSTYAQAVLKKSEERHSTKGKSRAATVLILILLSGFLGAIISSCSTQPIDANKLKHRDHHENWRI